jgi:hypothetical protein
MHLYKASEKPKWSHKEQKYTFLPPTQQSFHVFYKTLGHNSTGIQGRLLSKNSHILHTQFSLSTKSYKDLRLLTWLGVPLFKCSAGAESPKRDFSGLTSGVLLVLLAEDPEIYAWTDATTLACSGGTYLKHVNIRIGH